MISKLDLCWFFIHVLTVMEGKLIQFNLSKDEHVNGLLFTI